MSKFHTEKNSVSVSLFFFWGGLCQKEGTNENEKNPRLPPHPCHK